MDVLLEFIGNPIPKILTDILYFIFNNMKSPCEIKEENSVEEKYNNNGFIIYRKKYEKALYESMDK